MRMNLPYILQGGMKILNIVNKTLPLVKEFNPAYNYITKKVKSLNMRDKILPALNNTQQPQKQSRPNNNVPTPNNRMNNNNLTFFR